MAPSTTRRRATKVLTPRTPPPVVIECVVPELDGGRYAVKRIVGDTILVRADILKDGHDLLAARVRYSAPGDDEWRVVPMYYDENADQWAGGFKADRAGRWSFTVDAWSDRFGNWRSARRSRRGTSSFRDRRRTTPRITAPSRAQRSRCPASRSSASTSSISLPFTPLASRRARGRTTPSPRLRTIRGARGRLATRTAGTLLSSRSSARSRTSTRWSLRRRRWDSRSRSTTRCSARPIIRG